MTEMSVLLPPVFRKGILGNAGTMAATPPHIESETKVSPSPKSSWTAIGIAPICISTAALFVSLATFYFSNLRVSDHLHVLVTDAQVDPPAGGVTLRSRLMLFNSGNRPVSLGEIEYHCSGNGTSIDGSLNGTPSISPQDLPISIPAGEQRSLAVIIPLGFARQNFKSGRLITLSENKAAWAFQFWLSFTAYGSDRTPHRTDGRPLIDVAFDDTGLVQTSRTVSSSDALQLLP